METKHQDTTTLTEEYESILRKLTLFLDKDPWTAREVEAALTLDDSLMRLKLWGHDIGYEDGVLELADKEDGYLKSTTRYFLLGISKSIEQYVAVREQVTETSAKPATDAGAVTERLQGFVKDLTSHVAPFVTLREMRNCNGPIYEFRTGKKSLQPRISRIEYDTTPRVKRTLHSIPLAEPSFPDPKGMLLASPRSAQVGGSLGTRILAPPKSPLFPVGAIVSGTDQSGAFTNRQAILAGSPLLGKPSLADQASEIGRSSDYEGQEGGLHASQLTAKDRWKLVFDRIRYRFRVGDTPDPNLARYIHQPLKSRISLRLLRILPTTFGENVKCELIEVQPKSSLPDLLLSWNCEPFEAVSWLWSREVPDRTICIGDGSEWFSLEVPPSLHACLKAIRLYDKPRLIWIDFLCSGRSSTEELADQPLLFHSIFAAAENVCVWLGESDQTSDLAMDFIRTTARLPNSWWSENPMGDLPIFTQQLYAVRALLQRPWFSRRWVIQEVAWSRQCVIYCDRHTLSWEDFAAWISLVTDMETSTGRDNLPGVNLQDSHAFRIIDVCNNCFHSGIDHKRRYMMDLEYLVTSLAYFQVSIPHDTVYALLSLAARRASNAHNKARSRDTSPGKPLVQFDYKTMSVIGYHVDYNQPYDEFCAEFIRFSIHASGSLDIICRPWAPDVEASSPPYRKTKLPSWIKTMKRAKYQPQKDFPDMRWKHINGDTLVGHPISKGVKYRASNESTVDIGTLKFQKYRTHFSMYVRGFSIGEITFKSVASQAGNIPSEWPPFAGWDDDFFDPPEEYWRTLIGNQGLSGQQAPSYYSRIIKTLHSLSYQGTVFLAEELDLTAVTPLVRQILRKIQAIIRNRSLALISRGNALALVPRDSQIGDMICILDGCSVPVVLRRSFKTNAEIWEQRECLIREESAAVLIQRTYRKILLRRSSSPLKATARQEREAEAVTESVESGGDILGRVRYAAILVVFLSLLRVRPGDTPPSFNFGLVAFALLAFIQLYRVMIPSAGKADYPPRVGTAIQSPAARSRPPLTLSKPVEPYYFSLIGECYVHGMMQGEAIDVQKEEGLTTEIFEIV